MPELPDVEYFRRYLDSTSLYLDIERARVLDEELLEGVGAREVADRLAGAAFQETDRHGKFMFVRIDGRGWLVLHYGMSGRLEYWEGEDPPPEHTALLVDFRDGSHLAYICVRRLGRIGLTDAPGDVVRQRELGPDVLADEFDWEQFSRLLDGRRGYLKSALMDQHLMAGIGNEYSDEILFQCRLHPKTEVQRLDETQRREVFETLRRTLETYVAHLPDTDALAEDYLLPHRHGDGRCPRCGAELAKIEVIGRSAYYCPTCQKPD